MRIIINTDIQERFGKRIRQLRTDRKLSQEALADLAGIHWTYVGQIERGRRNPTLKNIEKLAKAFNISLSELFEFDK